MAVCKLTIILVCTTCLTTKGQAQTCCPGSTYTRFINWRFQCGIFKTLALDWIDCPKQCTTTLNCFSVNTYQSDNGTEICELVSGTKDSFENESCLVEKSGGEHNELMGIQPCSPHCHECETRKALRNGWYQLSSSAYKHFKTKKTWKDANDTCSANKASLATIDSELENSFIAEVFLKTSQVSAPNVKESMKALKYWKLDGNDEDVIIFGDASYEHNIAAALKLPGTAGSYATTPAAAIQSTSFTIGIWVKVYSISRLYCYFYSVQSKPLIFTVGFDARDRSLGARIFFNSVYFPQFTGGHLVLKKWTHIVGTWDRITKKAAIYQDGTQVGQVTSTSRVQPKYIDSFFDVGYKRNSRSLINGAMRELLVFDRPLTSQEVKHLKDITSIDGLANSLSAWVGTTHRYVNWAPDLQVNSTCISVRAWAPYQQDDVPCNETMEFICEKLVE